MFTANQWVAIATSIGCVLVFGGKDGGTSSSVTVGPSGICPMCVFVTSVIECDKTISKGHSL